MKIEQAVKQLEALGHPVRLQVYRTLVRAGRSGLPVSRVQRKLRIPASTLSHHLQRLVLTGLVTQERQATTLICRANYPAIEFAHRLHDQGVLRGRGLRVGGGRPGRLRRASSPAISIFPVLRHLKSE